jgi:probable HAF family extracellular repeat protein
MFLAAIASPHRFAAQEHHDSTTTTQHHYQLIDLGTLGGHASFINPPFNTYHSISRGGTVVGGSATAIFTNSNSDFFVCGGLDGLLPQVFHAFSFQNGVTTDLGALVSVSDCSNAEAVNARGQIIGTSENGVVDPIFGVNQFRAVVWQNGLIRDLGTFGGNFSSASSINDRGDVVGFALNAITDPVSILDWQIGGSTTGTQTRAFLWQEGALQDIGTLGGPDAIAAFVSNSGQVAGFSYTSSTINSTTGLPTTHPFLWKNGKMTDLGTLGGTLAGSVLNNMLGGVNNQGQVVGLSTLAGDAGCTGSLAGCVFMPFLYSNGNMINLNTHGGTGRPLSANALNDAGQVVGGGMFPGPIFDAYLWQSDVATDLGHLSGDCQSEGWAINASGTVVGVSVACSGMHNTTQRGFVWQNGNMTDLSTLVPPGSSMQLTWPEAINDAGEITGTGTPDGCANTSQCGHAFLLIPCDENHPDVEGCDYSLVDSGAPYLGPASTSARPQSIEGGARSGQSASGDAQALMLREDELWFRARETNSNIGISKLRCEVNSLGYYTGYCLEIAPVCKRTYDHYGCPTGRAPQSVHTSCGTYAPYQGCF